MKIENLKQLNALLGSEIIITGSTALAYHGLVEFEKAVDLDLIIVNATDVTKEVLKRLQSENPSAKFVEGLKLNYSFTYNGIKTDVWLQTEHEDKDYLVTGDGVKVASIRSIVNAKLSYNRAKDWLQLMQLAKNIYDEDKFKNTLSTIRTEDSDEYND